MAVTDGDWLWVVVVLSGFIFLVEWFWCDNEDVGDAQEGVCASCGTRECPSCGRRLARPRDPARPRRTFGHCYGYTRLDELRELLTEVISELEGRTEPSADESAISATSPGSSEANGADTDAAAAAAERNEKTEIYGERSFSSVHQQRQTSSDPEKLTDNEKPIGLQDTEHDQPAEP